MIMSPLPPYDEEKYTKKNPTQTRDFEVKDQC